MAGLFQSIGNLISGGTWKQSGGEIAAQNFSAEEAAKARDFAAVEAQKQRDFEERLSSSAYQRAVEDLKKAGLSVASMYSGGATQSSTPSGAVASNSVSSARGISNVRKSELGSMLGGVAALIKVISLLA